VRKYLRKDRNREKCVLSLYRCSLRLFIRRNPTCWPCQNALCSLRGISAASQLIKITPGRVYLGEFSEK
jgi:hypothetical protein